MTLRPGAEELVLRDFKFARSELFGKYYGWDGKRYVLSLLNLRSGDRHDRPHTTLLFWADVFDAMARRS